MLQNKKTAFTLIELLSSILIGSILLTGISATYKHMRNSNSVKEEKNYIYENALHFNIYFKKDILAAGYEEYNSDNGEIDEGFILDDNGTTDNTLDDTLTVVYDVNTSTRITHEYTYNDNKILITETETVDGKDTTTENIPLVAKVSDINWTIDSKNNKRIITNITFEGKNTDINNSNIKSSFKIINYLQN